MADEPAIVFSVKELISRLDGKLDAIMSVLVNKADRADVTALERRVDAVENKINTRETQESTTEKHKESSTVGRRFIITMVLTVLLSLAGTAVGVISLLAGHH